MKYFWNERIFKFLIITGIFTIMNFVIYWLNGFEIAMLLVLAMVEANIVINSDK